MNYLRGGFYLDVALHADLVAKVKKDLTFALPTMGGEPEHHVAFKRRRTHLVLPRGYGVSLGLDYEDRTAIGQPIASSMSAPTLRPAQEPFVKSVVKSLRKNKDITAKAHTGFGKSVVGLECARQLNCTTLIVVDIERLMGQWVETAEKVFGLDRSLIGTVQGNEIDFKGKSVVVAMAQTLFSRNMGNEFYNSFGLLIWDECRVAGAPVMSSIFLKVAARYRLGLDATPMRKDALETLLRYSMGEVEVSADKKHKASVVRVVDTQSVCSWYANISPKAGRYLQELSEDTERCILAAKVIKELYDKDRDILGLSDRVMHLYAIESLLLLMGVPPEDVGVYAGKTYSWEWQKNKSPARKPHGLQKGAPYTPVCFDIKERKTPSKEGEVILKTKKIILSTYGVFGKGVDVPRLSAGIELTPRASATQAQGRILRKYPGKPVPVWVSLRDCLSFRAENQMASRIKEYVNDSNSEVKIWNLAKHKLYAVPDPLKWATELRQKAKQLKMQKHTATEDGRRIITTKPTGRVSKLK